jgi:Domain of unknown function (DUF222)
VGFGNGDFLFGGDASEPSARDSRLPLFAQGRPGDRAVPNAWQVMVLSDVSGWDGSCPEATDDEVFGILGQWASVGSWAEARKLAVVRELIRRRPDPEAGGEPGLPAEWDDDLAREVSLQLGISVVAARKLIHRAWSLHARLPRIGDALNDGRLDPGKVRMIVEETDVLADPARLAQAEQMILAGLAKCKTWMDLLRLVQRAVAAVDPEGAVKRREKAERDHARVQFWRETSGACALAGRELPADEALAAMAHVEARAQYYRAAGVRRYIDILRVAAYLDILNGVPAAARIARFQAEDAAGASSADAAAQGAGATAGGSPAAASDPQAPAAGDQPASGEPARGSGDYDECPCNAPSDGAGSPGDPQGRPGGHAGGLSGDGPGRGSVPDQGPALAARANLTLPALDIPLLSALGLAQRPGQARGLGALDPGLARKLAEAAARDPRSRFCVTIVNASGHAIGHGCGKPRRARKGKAPPGTGTDPPDAGVPDGLTLVPSGKPGPVGGFGSWLLTLPGQAGEFTVDLHPVPSGECDHRYESSGHDPGGLLRHLVHVRDGTCGFPTCGRPAREADFEHAVPFEQGGRTCGCNGWACSRSCHQLKQSDGWTVTQPQPGWIQWTTPSGRVYTQEPWRYPALRESTAPLAGSGAAPAGGAAGPDRQARRKTSRQSTG